MGDPALYDQMTVGPYVGGEHIAHFNRCASGFCLVTQSNRTQKNAAECSYTMLEILPTLLDPVQGHQNDLAFLLNTIFVQCLP